MSVGIEVPTDTQWSQYTIEDYITENNLTVTPQEVVARWKFESDYRIAKSDIKVSSNKLQQNRLKQFELYKKLNISPETYQIISSHKADAANTRRLMGENADPNDPTNKSFEKDLQKIKFSRTSYKSVFDPATGQIRNGLSELRGDHDDLVGKKDNVVEIRKGFFVRLDAGAPIEARIAFELNKIDNNAKERKSEAEELLAKDPNADTSSTGWVKKGGKWVDNESLYSAGDASTLKEALADIWNKEHNKAVSIGLPLAEAERQANERAFSWFQRMASISFSQEYWDSMLSNKSFIEQLKVYLPTVENHPLWRIIQENNYKIAGILKKYQEVYDYREISVGDMTSFDRDLITALESANRERKEVLIQAVKDTSGIEDISIEYADMGERKPNNAFFDIFKDQRGKDYKSATTEERMTFVRGLLSAEKATSLEKLRNALEKHVKTKKPLGKVWSQVVEEITDEPIETVEDIRYVLEQYGQRILPSYYLRYAPEGYSELLDHIKDNFKNVVKGSNTILDRLIEGEDPNLEVTISQVTQEELGIKYEQSAEIYKRKLREAKALKDDSERLLRSYEAFLHIAGEDDGSFSDSTLDRSFLENFGMSITPEGNLTKPTKNLDDFQNLIDLLELRAISLEDNDQLLRTSVFQFAKLPKSNTERIMTNPKDGTKYIVKDMIQYREDEEEASFLRSESRRIPKIGFTNMPLEDVSTDLFAVAMADVYNGKLYKHRKNNLNTAIALHNLLLTQKIRGKNIKDTEAWAMGNNYIDANFYGKQTSWNTKVDILGKQVDVAKALSTFRKFVQLNGLGFSIPVALTSLTTATAAKIIQRPVNFHLYDKASNRANIEFTKLMAGGVQDIGKIYTDSRIERIMQLFGNYDIRERLTNTAFGYVGHNLDLNRLGFAVHQMANYPIIPRIALSKLMEYRIIDGKFTSWAVFKTNERAANPKITNSELKSKFDATASNSLYDYLLLEGNQVFDLKKLEDSKLLKNKDGSLMTAAEIEAYTKQLYVDVSSSISYNISQYDGVIDSSQKTEAHRHPIFNFLMMYRSWMSISGTRLFSPTRFDPSTATFEQGVITTFTSTLNSVIRDSVRNKENPFALARQTYNEMSPAQQANLRSLSFTLSAMSMMILITSLLVAAADDDDDDYITELAAYVVMRTLNETFNSSIGYPSELYSFLENPVTSSHTIKSITDILSVNNIGKEVTRGQYKGWDKYSTNLYKMTFLKNFYGLGSAESIESSRSGYQYFNEKQSLFSVLPLVTLLNEE